MPKARRTERRAKPLRKTNLAGLATDFKTEHEKFNQRYPSLANSLTAENYAKAMLSANSHSEKSRRMVVRILGKMLYDKKLTAEETAKVFREISEISGRAASFHVLGEGKFFRRRNP